MRLLYIYIVLATICAVSAVNAENVYLKDGRIITGRISNQSRTDITIETAAGQMRIQKDQIRRIQYDTALDDKAKEEARKAEERKRQEDLKRQQDEYKRQQDEVKRQQDLKTQEDKRKQEAADKLKTDKQKEDERKKREAENAANAGKVGPTWYGALARSLVLPGWGQYYEGRKRTAFAYGGAFLLAGVGTLYEQERYRKNRQVYADATNIFLIGTPLVTRNTFSFSQSDAQAAAWFVTGYGRNQAARQRMELHANRLEILKTSLLAFYVWNAADAVIFRPTQKTAIRAGTDGQGLQIALTTEF